MISALFLQTYELSEPESGSGFDTAAEAISARVANVANRLPPVITCTIYKVDTWKEFWLMFFVSAPEPKAQVHYCDHALSVVRRPSVVRPSSVRPSVVVNFSHFRLLLWNHWTEFDETLQEGRSQRPLPSLCFSGRSEKQDGRPGLWLAETFFDFSSETAEQNSTKLDRKQDLNVLYQVCVFRTDRKNKMAALASDWLRPLSTSSLKPLNGIQRNLTGSKISTSSTKFVFFGPIGKTRWPPWPLIGWDIFDFSSQTAERNSTKLDRKQDLNVLYQVCVFWADRKNKMAALASDWLRHFRLLLTNRWTEFNETWQKTRSQRPLPSLCFSGRSEKQDGRLGLWLAETFSTSPLILPNVIQRNLTGSKISTSSTKFVFFGPIGKTRWPSWLLIGWDIYDFSSETAERNSTKLDRKQDLNVLYQVCVFRADWKIKMAALASDWLRHFRLFLWNRWTEFNETWQEARSQCPLPSLSFSGRLEKQDGRPGGTLYSGARYVALWASCCSTNSTQLFATYLLYTYDNISSDVSADLFFLV